MPTSPLPSHTTHHAVHTRPKHTWVLVSSCFQRRRCRTDSNSLFSPQTPPTSRASSSVKALARLVRPVHLATISGPLPRLFASTSQRYVESRPPCTLSYTPGTCLKLPGAGVCFFRLRGYWRACTKSVIWPNLQSRSSGNGAVRPNLAMRAFRTRPSCRQLASTLTKLTQPTRRAIANSVPNAPTSTSSPTAVELITERMASPSDSPCTWAVARTPPAAP